MLFKALLPLCLIASAAALPYAAADAVPYALVKRDADSDFADATKAAETLGANAAEAIRKTGRCGSSCQLAIQSMAGCSQAGDMYGQADCFCTADNLSNVSGCGNCMGGDSKQAANQIKTLCSQNAAVISSGIASTATASSTIPAASAIVGAEAKSGASSFNSRYSLSGIAAGVAAGGAVLML